MVPRSSTLCLVCLLLLLAGPGSAFAVAAGAPAPASTPTATPAPVSTPTTASPPSLTPAADAPPETDTIIVRLRDPPTLGAAAADGRADAIEHRRVHATRTQSPIVDYVRSHPDLQVAHRFWLINAVVVSVANGTPPIEELGTVDHVTDVHTNVELETTVPHGGSKIASARVSTPTTTTSTVSAPASATAGVTRVGAPTVWNRTGNRGADVRVAVLDTGVEPAHPDVAIGADQWAEFGTNGTPIDSTPYDDNGHGTHVSGTVVGGNASGEWIGVAPNATLLHAKVLDSDGVGTFAQFVAGLEWAIESNADVVVMSFGTERKATQLIEPVFAAEQEGVPVVAAVGNRGVNTSSSPANVYESIAVGAVDRSDEVASFSGSETIDADEQWAQPPERWPRQYHVPDVVAPGTDVKSSVPDGGYARLRGTSMATPHVAGSLALLLASTDAELSPDHVRERIVTTSDPPPRNASESRDRYGAGIVNATALVDAPNAPVGSLTTPPRDRDGDGRYEDVNGDGEFNIIDVGALLRTYRSDTVQRNPQAFDFNDDSAVNIIDVGALLQKSLRRSG